MKYFSRNLSKDLWDDFEGEAAKLAMKEQSIIQLRFVICKKKKFN